MHCVSRVHRTVWGVFLGVTTMSPALGQNLVWSDEFNGAAVDRSYWTYDVGGSGFGNQELEYYTARPENVFLPDGNLVIQAKRESYSGKSFTSARLKTQGRMAFRYGTLQARIKVPNLANGLWPAFWMLGQNIGQTPWPGCGEVDILEMGSEAAIQGGIVNRWVQAAAHWDYNGSYAGYWLSTTASTPLNVDYHIYSLTWTPQLLAAYLDGVQFWAMDISDPNTNSLEEFRKPFYIVLNLAVGGINFVNITDPAQITAPFPARMYTDWIRLYDNGYTELTLAADTEEAGTFGIFTDTTPVNDAVSFDVDADLFAWHNVTIGAATSPYEGPGAWSFHVAAGDWWGLGVFSRVDRNMQNYSDGYLHFAMRTTTTMTLGVGIKSSAAGEGWYDLVNGGEQYGLVRDGAWHEVLIPLNRFGNVDFNTIGQLFMLRGVGQPGALTVDVDDVYWLPSGTRPTPENGSYGIFTETASHKTAGDCTLGLCSDFYIWANTMNPATQHPYEGTTCMSLASATAQTWFGAAFMARTKHNLTAFRYPASKLHFALKTNSTVTFQIGMKSGSVDDIGQKWIRFQNGSDPYGFVRDGQWHVVEIPMTDFAGVDLREVSQLFELLGTDGPITNVEFDDVCFLYGGTALHPGGPGDLNGDGYVDVLDFARFTPYLVGPGVTNPPHGYSVGDFARADLDGDDDVDLADFTGFQAAFAGSGP